MASDLICQLLMPAASSSDKNLVGFRVTPIATSSELILVSDEPVRSKLFRLPIRLDALSFVRVISAAANRLNLSFFEIRIYRTSLNKSL